MRRLKSIYEKLKPEFKNELQKNAKKYDSAKRLKYNLMSNTLWSDLTLSNMSDISVFCNVEMYKLTAQDIMFGKQILKD